MREICKYSEPESITPTNPDMVDTFKQDVRNGIVADNSSKAFYNMLKESGDIGMRISDEFDFIEYDNAVRTYRKRLEDENIDD